VTGEQVLIRRGSLSDEPEFLAAVDRSRGLHHPWVQPPNTPGAYRDYLSKHQEPQGIAFFIWLEASRGLVGVVNVSEIVQGCFRSAYLGYYAFVPFAGRGLMKEGLGASSPRGQHSASQSRFESAGQETWIPPRGIVSAIPEDQRPLARSRALGNPVRGLVTCPVRRALPFD
jgi:RimJ/RimL family protein N-acetyltransferase